MARQGCAQRECCRFHTALKISYCLECCICFFFSSCIPFSLKVMSGGTSVLERKPMLQRIYGTAWENEEQLKAYLHFKEEAKRRDHRRLGQDLDLFSIQVKLTVLFILPIVLLIDFAFYFLFY